MKNHGFGVLCLLIAFVPMAYSQTAPQCSSVFPDAATSFSPSGSIEFDSSSSRLLGGDQFINFRDIDRSGNQNCSGQRCESSGQTSDSLSLEPFQNSSSNQNIELGENRQRTIAPGDYRNIELDERARLTITANGITRINSLEAGERARVTLSEGVYWIRSLELDEEARIIIPAGETVLLYVEDLEAGEESRINADGSAGQLLIVSYDSVEFDEDSRINAFVYAVNSVEFDEGIRFNGSVSTTNLEIEEDTRLTYQPSEVDQLAASGLCGVLAPSAVAYYSIVHPAVGLTCEAATVVLSACADSSCNLVTEPVSVSFPDNSGETFSFTGQVRISVRRTIPGIETLNVIPRDTVSTPTGPTQCSGNCSIEFREAALVFVDQNNGLSTSLPDIVAESGLSQIGIRAVEDNQGVCEAALVGQQTIELGYDCVPDPTAYSPDICRVPFANVPVQGDGSGVSSANINVTFDANGVASLSGTYNDVGRLGLFASGDFGTFSLDSGPSGASFDSIPQRLEIQQNSATQQVAGDPFTLSIEALGAVGDNPLPSYVPANLQYSYSRITPTATLDSALEARLSLGSLATLVSDLAPSMQDVSALTFTNGVFTTDLASNNEVGEYSLALQDSNYLGNVIASNTESFGRFIPAYFDVTANAPRLEAACSGVFSYLGQMSQFEVGREPIFTVTAYNAGGDITRLYSDALWALNPTTNEIASGITLLDESAFSLPMDEDVSVLSTGLSENADYDGDGELLLNNLLVAYEKPDVPDASLQPFASQFTLTLSASVFTDGDGVCYRTNYVDESNPGNCSNVSLKGIGDAQQRYGRLNLINTYGPETRALRVPIQAEFFDRGLWQLNTADSCTTIDYAQSSGEITVSNASSADEANIVSQYQTITSTGTLLNGLSGTDDLVFAATQNGERGSVNVQLNPNAAGATWTEFLNIDWNNDGVIDNSDAPGALVSFGLYRGNDRIFHTREVNE